MAILHGHELYCLFQYGVTGRFDLSVVSVGFMMRELKSMPKEEFSTNQRAPYISC